ncbi:MAG TPA: hypothetical protein VLJ61_07210 [Pyrinomonadaceae bacterium]|nr:hypothetical protein [Pyrinomonadaceae bacterium]
MVLTRNGGDAELVVEIARKTFTRRFTFIVIDPRTMKVVTSGKARDVLFGKKIAEKFANRVKLVRPQRRRVLDCNRFSPSAVRVAARCYAP